ncbi:phage terminase large subunit family protein [Scandinavium goeteborgense]|uniref:phage terminase large subunit family protein n=1 Tax=Scandinavium goeteborgense TaxID=1851514 RepID=UPI0021651C97|nr:phage terminase large subunit family protein [Scandinavium goeteborgense]
MNISTAQIRNMIKAAREGLAGLLRPIPMTPVEWANEHYYLPKESSYNTGRWETLPFQAAIMNSMGNDEIRTVNFIKSARVGYTKMLLAIMAYFVEHKTRNCLMFQPTDADAENFMKSHVEPTIREVPALKSLAPWYGKKNRDNTLSMKRFSHGIGLWCLGGKAAKNYREKSVDAVMYDELAAFDADIEKEGPPTQLGDKRIEGSVWPKSIRGSTPKIKGECQIEKAAAESDHMMRFHVPCPHCGEKQFLKFGDDVTPFGMRWEPGKPATVYYLCEHNGCVIYQAEICQDEGIWICDNTGLNTRNGLTWLNSDGSAAHPPRSVSFHIWTAYSPFTTWEQIIWDYMAAQKDPHGLKGFWNTTLGETWADDAGEQLDHEILLRRREKYAAQVPDRAVYLTGGIDSQTSGRYECYVWGWGAGEECWLIDKVIVLGRYDEEETLQRVDGVIRRQYKRKDGTLVGVSRWAWDTGGIDPHIVYQRSIKLGKMWVIPIKGANVYGGPVANMPRTVNKHKVYLTMIGTDTAKELIYSRLKIEPSADHPVGGAIHFPDDDELFGESEAKQLTAEVRIPKLTNGKVVYRWDNQKRRNETLDCQVYALAALRVSISRLQVDLDMLTAVMSGKGKENIVSMSDMGKALGS